MTIPPYSGRSNAHQRTHSSSLTDTGMDIRPTPIVSYRDDDFTLEDLQFLAQKFGIADIEHADDPTTETRVWVDKRPGTDTSIRHLDALDNRHMAIHRGDYIRAAFRLPDGTERVIWEHAVFDDGERTTLEPGPALVEAHAADWDSLPALETPSQQLSQNND